MNIWTVYFINLFQGISEYVVSFVSVGDVNRLCGEFSKQILVCHLGLHWTWYFAAVRCRCFESPMRRFWPVSRICLVPWNSEPVVKRFGWGDDTN